MTFQKYENHLNSLIEKGLIVSYDDNSSKGTHYIIKFNRATLQNRIERGLLEAFLKLTESETENLTCLDENGKLIVFKNSSDLIRYFVRFRLSFYDRRKEFILSDLQSQNQRLSNRARFIKMIIDKKLNLANRPKADIVIDLEKLKFDQIESSFDYLLNMPIQSMTREKYEALLAEVSENEAEIKRIEGIQPIDMYRSDLKDLRKKLIK
jgi:DNA topoisomerase-2